MPQPLGPPVPLAHPRPIFRVQFGLIEMKLELDPNRIDSSIPEQEDRSITVQRDVVLVPRRENKCFASASHERVMPDDVGNILEALRTAKLVRSS